MLYNFQINISPFKTNQQVKHTAVLSELKVKVKSLSRVGLLATPWTAASRLLGPKIQLVNIRKKKQTHRYGEQTGGYQGEGGTNCYV